MTIEEILERLDTIVGELGEYGAHLEDTVEEDNDRLVFTRSAFEHLVRAEDNLEELVALVDGDE